MLSDRFDRIATRGGALARRELQPVDLSARGRCARRLRDGEARNGESIRARFGERAPCWGRVLAAFAGPIRTPRAKLALCRSVRYQLVETRGQQGLDDAFGILTTR